MGGVLGSPNLLIWPYASNKRKRHRRFTVGYQLLVVRFEWKKDQTRVLFPVIKEYDNIYSVISKTICLFYLSQAAIHTLRCEVIRITKDSDRRQPDFTAVCT